MKTSKKDIATEISKKIADIKKNDEDKILLKLLLKKHIPRFQVSQIIANQQTLELLSEGYLFAICVAINETSSKIQIEKHFTDIEIEEHKDWEYIEDDEITDQNIVFQNVLPLGDVRGGMSDQFVTFVTVQDLAKLFNKGLLNYNFETQRQASYYYHDGTLHKRISINNKAVNEIAELILDDEFIPNFITLNVLKDGKEEIIYDSVNKTLTIKAGSLDVLDGMHRTLGIQKASEKNPLLNISFGVMITNFDISKARKYIIQEDKKNKISKDHIKNITDDFSKYVMDIIKDKSKDFKNIVASNEYALKTNPKYKILESHLRFCIDKAFNIRTTREAYRIGEAIVPHLDNLYGYMEEKRIDPSFLSIQKTMISFLIIFKDSGERMISDDEIEKVIEITKNYNLKNTPVEEIKVKMKKIINERGEE